MNEVPSYVYDKNIMNMHHELVSIYQSECKYTWYMLLFQ